MFSRTQRIYEILIVDDKAENLFALDQLLKRLPDVRVIQAASGNDALALTLEHDFCLAIVDVQMPEMDGYELVELLRGNQYTAQLPVIFVSAIFSDEYHHRKGYGVGAVDFMTKPYIPEILISKVRVFINLYEQRLQLVDWSHSLEFLVAQRTEELAQAYDSTLEGWAMALEMKEQETAGHSRRVVEQTMKMAELMGIAPEEREHIYRGALLHDIGKIAVPDGILLKRGPLDETEWAVMRKHPVTAYQLLNSINFLVPALDIPFCHHERWDGLGYPRGLRGEQIPISARIFAVVDVFDALLRKRSYKEAWPYEKALDYIRCEAGQHFDPRVVEVFIRMVHQTSGLD